MYKVELKTGIANFIRLTAFKFAAGQHSFLAAPKVASSEQAQRIFLSTHKPVSMAKMVVTMVFTADWCSPVVERPDRYQLSGLFSVPAAFQMIRLTKGP